jgi:hypothetical protein
LQLKQPLKIKLAKMTYSHFEISELMVKRADVNQRVVALQADYLEFDFKNEIAKEHSHHGLSRRLKTMARCINNVFEKIPPDRTDRPDQNERTDAAIYLQAFLFNLFGALDNLAWIWVHERNVLDSRRRELNQRHIGLSPKNTSVRNSFSPELQECLNQLNDWFAYLENYRHALAHRIPLYIPPYIVSPENMVANEQLEQDSLYMFVPIVTHSFSEQVRPVYFHFQMLADFATVETLAQKVMVELISGNQS